MIANPEYRCADCGAHCGCDAVHRDCGRREPRLHHPDRVGRVEPLDLDQLQQDAAQDTRARFPGE